MNRTERRFALSAATALVALGVAWLLVGRDPGRPRGGGGRVLAPEVPDPTSPRPVEGAGPAAGPASLATGESPPPRYTGGGAGLTGLRDPSGEDLSDPAHVRELLRTHLAAADVRWDWVAKLLSVFGGTLDPDVRWALESQLVHGNAAGAIQAYQSLRDGSVVPDLLRLLDDPKADPHDLGNVLAALASIPGADAKAVVTGIESRMTGDLAHDAPYLRAIGRRGGAEAVRAFVEAIGRAKDPDAFSPDLWRDVDLRTDPAASEILAEALTNPRSSERAVRAIVQLSGRPGAGPTVVDALVAFDREGVDRAIRGQALESLARTGDERAVAHLLDLASKGADFASVASRAISDLSAATAPTRVRLLETAKATSDDNLRRHVVSALGNLREEKAIPLLSDLVSTGSDLVRKEAVLSLSRIGPSAAASVEALSAAYRDGDETMRSHVAVALGSIATDDARRALEQAAVAEKDPRVKKAIQASLRRIEMKKS